MTLSINLYNWFLEHHLPKRNDGWRFSRFIDLARDYEADNARQQDEIAKLKEELQEEKLTRAAYQVTVQDLEEDIESNEQTLNGFLDRIAQLKKELADSASDRTLLEKRVKALEHQLSIFKWLSEKQAPPARGTLEEWVKFHQQLSAPTVMAVVEPSGEMTLELTPQAKLDLIKLIVDLARELL